MPLKTEFDNKAFWYVLLRAFAGTIVGSVPGILYFMLAGGAPQAYSFAVTLIQTGTMVGAFSLGLAALAATMVATLKSRGSVPQLQKARRLQEYLSPEPMPMVPAASKPETRSINSSLEEPRETNLPSATKKLQEAEKPSSTVASHESTLSPEEPEQPSFRDYDQK
ncbi:MAG TPA: hypothetical protein PKA06_04330 [Gemmatales bacterium]|nr:hypothetical protein [Gemmatales bacterium]HMP16126.1 hypothetical protein [Gemmatales bacterium]